MTKKPTKIFRITIISCFIIYILVLLKLIIFRPYFNYNIKIIIENWRIYSIGRYNVNLIPFKTIINYINAYKNELLSTRIIVVNLIGNIVVFIPFGFLLPIIFRKFKSLFSIIISTFLFVLSMEIIQLLTYVGSFDVDDIILNVLGAIIGYVIYKIIFTNIIDDLNFE